MKESIPHPPSTPYRSNSSSSSSSSLFTIQTLIDDILNKKIKRIVVMTGAGISTASGISDFRSSETGLYDNLDTYNIPYPEAIFEKSFFRRNPEPFFKLAKHLMPNIEKYKPNRIHYFLRLLQDKNVLQRIYTQNIDGLESISGIESKKLVEAHGSFRSARCLRCNSLYSGLYVKENVKINKIPYCYRNNCKGVVKPDIVFFEEKLPDAFYEMHDSDFLLADFILVMGTSLQVEPFANIIKKSRMNVPRLLLNKESVGPFKMIKMKNANNNGTSLSKNGKDLQILGNLTDCVDLIVEKLGWTKELNELMTRELKILDTLKNQFLEKHFYIIIVESPALAPSRSSTKNTSKFSLKRSQSKSKLEKGKEKRLDTNKQHHKQFNQSSIIDISNRNLYNKLLVNNNQISEKANSLVKNYFGFYGNSNAFSRLTKSSSSQASKLDYINKNKEINDASDCSLDDSAESSDDSDDSDNSVDPTDILKKIKEISCLTNYRDYKTKLASSPSVLKKENEKVKRLNSILNINSNQESSKENHNMQNFQRYFNHHAAMITANSKPLLIKKLSSSMSTNNISSTYSNKLAITD